MCELSRDDLLKELNEHCSKNVWCDSCELYQNKLCNEDTVRAILPIEELTPMWDILHPQVDEDVPTVEYDEISHPKHYCRDGAMECIDEMVLLFGKEVVKHFALCNIWKYRYRSNDKNGEQDVKKSDEYVQIYKRLCDEY